MKKAYAPAPQRGGAECTLKFLRSGVAMRWSKGTGVEPGRRGWSVQVAAAFVALCLAGCGSETVSTLEVAPIKEDVPTFAAAPGCTSAGLLAVSGSCFDDPKWAAVAGNTCASKGTELAAWTVHTPCDDGGFGGVKYVCCEPGSADDGGPNEPLARQHRGRGRRLRRVRDGSDRATGLGHQPAAPRNGRWRRRGR